MRWFKHYADASDDEFIAIIEDRFGLEGYARWWKLLEVIAKQMDKTERCSATYPLYKWETFLKAKRKQMLCFLEATEKQGKTKLIRNGNVLTIECPKLLGIRDEYSKKSGHAPDKCPPKKKEAEAEADKDTDKDKDITEQVSLGLPALDLFEAWWKGYPNKADKKKAKEAWKKLKPDPDLVATMTKAVENQIIWRETARPGKDFRPPWKNGATWINGECWNNPTDDNVGAVVESRHVKCRNPEKYPPCNRVWDLNERPNCPRCGWKYEALND